MKNVHVCYIRVEKIENLKKEGKMRISALIQFTPYTFCLPESVHKIS